MRFLNKRGPAEVRWYLYHKETKMYVGIEGLVSEKDLACYFEGDNESSSKDIKATFEIPENIKSNELECVGEYI